mmetsp:Transcript_98883/g.247966  ORF Transcript_98883/g.247966 Transcript_98883/m.247966 type:complete len:290 (+) Transcript_98883:495-1364(+)
MSASAESAQSGGFFLAASAKLFFTHVKHIMRSSCEKPTLSSGPQSRGKSCIMHSNLVGDLNLVLPSSAHLGLTNSGTMPPVVSKQRAIVDSWNTKTLMLPGYGEKPLASGSSPPAGVSFKSGSSWLYSTLMVKLRPPFVSCKVQMPPIASLGSLGTATEFMAKPFFWETPNTAQRLRKGSGLVSWNTSNQSRPSSAHFLGRPVWCSSAWTSPWPWGLVSTLPPVEAMRASTSFNAGTNSCFMSVIWRWLKPKFAFESSNSHVFECVSPDVIIARGNSKVLSPVTLRAYA